MIPGWEIRGQTEGGLSVTIRSPQIDRPEAIHDGTWWPRYRQAQGELTPDEARIGASHEVDQLLAIIDRLTGGAA